MYGQGNLKPYARATGEHLQAYEALLAPHPVLVTWTKRALYFDATRAECWGSGSCVTDPVAGLGEIMKCFNHLEFKSPDRQTHSKDGLLPKGVLQ